MPRSAFLYLAISCLLWALIPTLFFLNPPLDVVEGFAWGRELALGYTKHPPLPSWALEAVYLLTGRHVFGAYWLSAACIALAYWALWHLGRGLGFNRQQTSWGLMLTSVIFYFTLPLPEFNHNIAQIPIWSAMMLVFHKALSRRRLLDWLLLGLLAAIGLYTKYFVLLLIGTIGLYTLVFRDARRCLGTLGPYLAAVLCLVLLIPHLVWLVDTHWLTLRYAASRSHSANSWLDHITNPLNFFLAQISNHAGLFIILLAGFWGSLRFWKTTGDHNAPANVLSPESRRFLIWFACLPLSVLVLASLITGSEFEHMWGTPLFVLSGFLAVSLLPVTGERFNTKRAFRATCLVQAIFLCVLFGQAVLEPLWKTKYTRIHYPGQEIATAMEEVWKTETHRPLEYVAGDMWSAANVTVFASTRPHMFYLQDLELSPWINAEDLQAKGVMLLWRGEKENAPKDLLKYYPDLQRQGHKTFVFGGHGTIPPVTVNWVIIPSGQVQLSPAAE